MKNEKEWFSENIRNYHNGLYRLAFGILKNEEDAKDAIQETLYKAYLKLDTLKDRKKFKPWIMRILTNTALEMVEKKKYTVPLDTQQEFACNEPDIDSGTKLVMWDCVQALDTQYRTVTILFYYEDMSVKEIAAITGAKPDAVKKQLSRAREQLKKQFDRMEVF